MKSMKLGGFALVFLLVLAFTLTGFVPSLDAQSVELQYSDDDPDVDSRWLPWIGCWELVLETVGHLEEYPEDVLVCLSPVKSESGVRITTWAGGEIILAETLFVDGERRPLEEAAAESIAKAEIDCRGWQSAKWSADGHRLFLHSEATCESDIQRHNSGVNLLVSGPRWIDVQLVRAGDVRELIIRKYRRASERTIAESGAVVPSIAWATSYDWLEAEKSMGLDDIIEASRIIDSEAVEAALMESEVEFALGSESLIRLADAKVPEELIDLMVALSYPEDFRIGRLGARKRKSFGSGGGGGGGYGGYGPIYYDDPYAYWYPFFFAPFGYSAYNYGYASYGGYYLLPPSGGGEIPETTTHGRVVAGKGYSRVWPRERESSGRRGGYSSGDGYSQSGGGDSGGGVSQGGYSGGGSSTGRTAKPKNNN